MFALVRPLRIHDLHAQNIVIATWAGCMFRDGKSEGNEVQQQ